MRKTLIAVSTALATLAIGAVPGSAGTAEAPEITDPAGEANFLSPITGDEEDTRPVSFDSLDLRAVWFETAYDTNRAVDPESGEVLSVQYTPTALLVHIKTEAPVRPFSPFNAVRYKAQATAPDCNASFELRVFNNPDSDSAEIRRVDPLAPCGELPSGNIIVSPVKPTFDGTVATLTFPLSHEGVREVIWTGATLSQPSAHSEASLQSNWIADRTAAGGEFRIGQDVPPNVDCTADPDHTECQP